MQKEIMAGLYHSTNLADKDEQHQYCVGTQWCKYHNDRETYKEDARLPSSFLPYMKRVYERLSDIKLLQRCLPGLTQNQNESFNSLIWARCPKERSFGPKFVNRAVYSAILHWNIGATSRERVMERMALSVGQHTQTINDKKDTDRINQSVRRANDDQKQKRKQKKDDKIRSEEQQLEIEGPTYGSGLFGDISD
ncbi:uncharacterized protein LOC117103531 [Anneissia japonica]|uniref:uncharacterized protein LOC117103531 n=1 Tax=Anneissia japonica TaxID=1529436 RepID=UPI0014258E27|nr:uncharacterized protein LOC117103531 [Anneissia japonica]